MINALRNLAALVFLLTALVSCSEVAHVGEPPSDNGELLSVTEAISPTTFGRTVRVQGRVHEVCQDEGCWMSITDGTSYLRMTFSSQSILVPMTLTGDVIVEGIVAEEVIDAETAKAIGSTIGWSDEQREQAIGDQRVPLMTATGVLFLDDQS